MTSTTTDKKSLDSRDKSDDSVLLETAAAEDEAWERELLSPLNLHQAVEAGNYELAKFLVESDINLIDSIDDDIYGRTPLIICSFKKSDSHYKLAKFLLACGCDVNVQGNYKWNNWTALMTACYHDNARMCELLIEANANVELEDIESNTAWQLALENSHSACIQLLLKEMERKGIEARLAIEKEIQDAVYSNELDAVKQSLLKLDEPASLRQLINSTPIGTHSLLYRACRNGNASMVRLLLDHGSIAREHYYTRYSPLYIACHMGNFEIADMLIKQFPHLIRVKTIEKFLPFHACCSQGRLELVKYLVETSTSTVDMDSAIQQLDKSADSLSSSMARFIGAHRSVDGQWYLGYFDLNALDFNDQNGLFAAVVANKTEICEYLLRSVRVRKLTSKDVVKYKRMKKLLHRRIGMLSSTSSSSSLSSSESKPIPVKPSLQTQTSDQAGKAPGTPSSSGPSFFDQLKNVFMDIKPPFDAYTINYTSAFFEEEETDKETEAEVKAESQEAGDESDQPAHGEPLQEQPQPQEEAPTFFNPISVNQYSKFGTTCIHEAVRNRNHQLVKLLLAHGADSNLPIYEAASGGGNGNSGEASQLMTTGQESSVKSNALCEALRLRDEYMVRLLVNSCEVSELNFKMALKSCHDLAAAVVAMDTSQSQPNEAFEFYKRRMTGLLLRSKLVADNEYKVNVHHALRLRTLQSQMSMSMSSNNLAAGQQLMANSMTSSQTSSFNDSGLILNWTGLEPKLDVLFESWLLECAKHFKLSNKFIQSTTTPPARRTDQDNILTPVRDEQVNSLDFLSSDISIGVLPDPIQQSLKRLHLHAITRIDLAGNLLEAVPLAIFQIESLRFLRLSGNKIKVLPSNRHPVFDDLLDQSASAASSSSWTCHLLDEMDISDNQIAGQLPPSLFQLKSLKHLNASKNAIERLPFELWSAPSLFDLNLAHNQLGYLPLVPPVSTCHHHHHVGGGRYSKKSMAATATASFNRSRRDDFSGQQPPAVVQKPTSLMTSSSSRHQLSARVPVTDHPLKSPDDEQFQVSIEPQRESLPQPVELQARFEEREVVKANFWRTNSSDSANISLYCGMGLGSNNLTSSASKHAELTSKVPATSMMRASQSIGSALASSSATATGQHGQSASKLVELNLAFNSFKRIPECISCLMPKLVKLNMSSNQLKSMGAICDLPASLKFLDLSSNQIKWPMRLLNNDLMRFILVYYEKYDSAPSPSSSVFSASIDLANSLLMNNEFCYLSLVNKLKLSRGGGAGSTPTDSALADSASNVASVSSRRANRHEEHQNQSRQLYPGAMMPNSSSSFSIVQPPNANNSYVQSHIRSKTRDPHRQQAPMTPIMAAMEPAANSRARSNSRRRTRSQSRNNFLNRSNNAAAPSPGNHQMTNTTPGKKILPFDLFLVNLRYNQSYQSSGGSQVAAKPAADQQQFSSLTMHDLFSPSNKLANEFLELKFHHADRSSPLQPMTKSPESSYDLSASSSVQHYDDSDEEELFYWFKEKQLLNRYNIQVFLDQLCPHKRHLKLENLKSLNLSNNKLGTCHILFDLDQQQPYSQVEDVASTILNRIRNLRSAAFSPSFPSPAKTSGGGLSDDDLLSEDYDSDNDSGNEDSSFSTPRSRPPVQSSPVSSGKPPPSLTAKKPSRTRLRDKLFSPTLPNTSHTSSHSTPKSMSSNYNRKHLKFWTKSEQRARLVAKLIYPNLTHLDVSANRIRKLPSTLSLLDHLSYLNASSNSKLTRVSPSIGLLTKLWNFDLKNCSIITDPPMLDTLVKQRIKTSDLLGYLKSILEHSRPYNRVKLMLVGVQAIGKTSLLGKLRDEGVQKSSQTSSSWNERTSNASNTGGSSSSSSSSSSPNISTVGIDINEWVYEKPKSSRINLISQEQSTPQLYQYPVDSQAASAAATNKTFGPITFRTWDFGGQREYYSTHQYFISKRALYLVCWKLSEHEKGINEIHTWLSNIQTRAPGSPVIIVGTHQDQLTKLKNYKEISAHLQRIIYERFVLRGASGTCETNETSAAYPPIMASIEVSSKTGHNIKLLARLIYEVAAQMKAPGLKDQLLLEQKIPVTYLALEECVVHILSKLKQAGRNPVLNKADYLKEVREAAESLYPDPDQAEQAMVRAAPTSHSLLECPMLIRFRDDAEILQATQFMHENGVLVHYNDVALRDLFFLDPQWLCDVLATVVAIREVNPFAAKGIMKIKDLLVLFKGRRFGAISASTSTSTAQQPQSPMRSVVKQTTTASDCDEIMGFIVDLLGKFELALTWDNEHLLIPSLLPSEAMLKFANQDIRMGIVSKQKAYSDQINSISFNNLISTNVHSPPPPSAAIAASASFSSFLNANFDPSVSAPNLLQVANNNSFKLVNSVSQMAFPPSSHPQSGGQNATAADCPFQSKPYFSESNSASSNDPTNIVRLYCLSYLPSGFFSRLITRILSDSILKEYLLELIELEYCLFNSTDNSEDLAADPVTQTSLEALIDFVCQEAEWRCWQTGIELKYLDYTLIRIKELIQDPLIDLNTNSVAPSTSNLGASAGSGSQQQYTPDVFLSRPLLYRDCENELKLKSTFPLTLTSTSKQPPFAFMECYASFTNYKIVKSKSKSFLKRKQSDGSASRSDESADESDILVKIMCNRRICIKLFAQIIEIIDSLLEDWYPDLGTRFMQDSKGDYLVTRLTPCNQCIQDVLDNSSRAGRSRAGSARSTGLTTATTNRPISTNTTSDDQVSAPSSYTEASSFISHIYSAYKSPNQSYEMPMKSANQLTIDGLSSESSSFRDRSISFDDFDELEKLKYFNHFDWIFGFMLDDICYAVLSSQQQSAVNESTAPSVEATLLRCPRHGHQSPRQMAPDLAFEDVDEKLLINSNQKNLSIENLLGRGSFGSVFSGSLHIKDKSIKVAVKVLESIPNNASITSFIKLNSEQPAANSRLAVAPAQPVPAPTGSRTSGRSNLSRFWNYRKSVRLAAKAYTQARQEIAILNTLKQDNIVAMLGLSVQPLAIILELAPKGNLKDLLAQYKAALCKLSANVVQTACSQISSALVYLHSNRIIYRDLKADNVLVWRFPSPPSNQQQLTPSTSAYSSSSYVLNKQQQFLTNEVNDLSSGESVLLKLADYSISRTILPTGTKGFAGTEGFMAPEIIRFNGEETYSEKVDCFSFAMLAYELISLKHPFEGQEQIKDIVLNGGRPPITAHEASYPTLMLDLMCLCWQDNPNDRPSASDINKYCRAYEFSHLLDVAVLEDYEQPPLMVTCLNQETDEMDEDEDEEEENLNLIYSNSAAGKVTTGPVDYYGYDGAEGDADGEVEEEEEEDVMDLWIVRNSVDEGMSQLEILTYENKFNCTNRKLINVCSEPIEAICVYKSTQVWCVDSFKCIYIFCSKTYRKLNQYLLDIKLKSRIEWIYSLDNLDKLLMCSNDGTILILKAVDFKSMSPADDLEYIMFSLSIPVYSSIILPTRYDKSYDLWMGSEGGEIFSFSLKNMRLLGSYLHSTSHHYQTNTMMTLAGGGANEAASWSSGETSSHVTLLRTTPNDTFFLWSYVYPGSTVYLWNHASKKIMSAFNLKKAFADLNFTPNPGCDRADFRVVDMNFLNGHLYCGVNYGVVVVLKRLTLTPLLAFNAHMHQLHKLCPLTFETRIITTTTTTSQARKLSPSNEQASAAATTAAKQTSTTSMTKKTQHMLVTLGRALAPCHEEIYLANPRYRVDALSKYANCLILCSWSQITD